jgi:hypothetical protein
VKKRKAADDNNEDDEQNEKIGDEVLVHLIRTNHSSVFSACLGIFSEQPETLDKLSFEQTVWPSR